MTNLSRLFLTMLSTLYTGEDNRAKNTSKTLQIPYLRQPALSPDGGEIAFCYAGDLWIVPAMGGVARRITAHANYDSFPIFSPDGAQLAFASQRTGGGNIYVIPLKSSGAPRRLTYHNASAPPACWSPDGKWIYFTSGYDGLCGASYKVHVDGGTPVRIAGDALETHYHLAISPDGKRFAFNNNGHPWWRHGPHPSGHSDIWVMSEALGAADHRRLTRYLGRNLRPMWNADGSGLYYLCDREGEENIWFMPLEGDESAEPITHFTSGRVLRPSISADGKWIAFERDFQLWRLNLEAREAEPVEIIVQTDEKTTPINHQTHTANINEFELSPDGKKVAFIVHGEVFADLADKGDKVKKGGDSFKATDTPARESQLQWHSASDRVVYVSDRTGHNEIFQYDFKARQETQLTDSPELKYAPTFSPDGKWLAYIQGNAAIWLMNTETHEKRPFITDQVFTGVPVPTDFEWSPDSKWIAFIAQDANFFSNLYAQHIEAEVPKPLTFLSNISSYRILWSPDGKFIVFNTGQYRTETQIARVDLKPIPPLFKEEDFDKLFEEEKEKEKEKDKDTPQPPEAQSKVEPVASLFHNGGLSAESEPAKEKSNNESDDKKEKDKKKKKIEPVEIEFETIKHRLRFLTDFKLNAQAMCIRPDGKTLVFCASMTGQPNLWSLSLEGDKQSELPKQLTSTAGSKESVYFLPEGKKFYYLDGGRIHSLGMNEEGAKDGDAKALDTKAEIEVNFHLEKMQAFDEAWTMIRNHFYDPHFHGCDWEGVRDQFRPIVQGAQTQADFREILNLMVGELNASHLGAGGGNESAPDSYLGADFDRGELERDGHFKITYILPQSPLALPKEPARVGEYLVAVDRVELNGRVNLDEQLQRKSGKRVRLKLNDTPRSEIGGAREVIVQPIDSGKHTDLRYKDWVRRNGEYVNEKSNGRLGYVHIRAMSHEAYLQFIADLDTETHSKEGVIIDVRFNGGGHIAPFILDVLHR
ncbi:PD40 domain-containing protein, partial [Candidatus Poribacteria bacterium]|nr:PD40 domain-containing protein [Candidatus Poribacteria bacterium]